MPVLQLPSWQDRQIGAQTVQQQEPHSRQASPDDSQAIHESMAQATQQAQLDKHRQVKTLLTVFINKNISELSLPISYISTIQILSS